MEQTQNTTNWLADELIKIERLEKRRIKLKDYYERNKIEINKKINNIKKNNKWKYYQNPQSKLDKSIKNKTRYKFPIKNHICQVCFGKKADHHHHTTRPLKVDKFIYICQECHKNIHNQLNQNGGNN